MFLNVVQIIEKEYDSKPVIIFHNAIHEHISEEADIKITHQEVTTALRALLTASRRSAKMLRTVEFSTTLVTSLLLQWQ